MSTYLFGIQEYLADELLASRIHKAQEDDKLEELATALAGEAGAHVLPKLRGDDEELAPVRSRHLEWLRVLFSDEELKASLLAELERFSHVHVTDPEPDVVVDGDSLFIDKCWFWVCEPDFEDPLWCYWEEYCDWEGNPLNGKTCYEFGPDGVMYEVPCLGEDSPLAS